MSKIYLNIKKTIQELLLQEDTDFDKKITIEDSGPKKFNLKTDSGEINVEGTYHLSNLLQELILAREKKLDFIDTRFIFELPVDRISRMIKDYFWDELTRTMDEKGIQKILIDDKSKAKKAIIYVPFNDTFALNYYKNLAEKYTFEVKQLPQNCTPEYVNSLNDFGGILALALAKKNKKIVAKPFVVPGGRFNEMYGWDSYFINIGLLIDKKRILAKSMVENFGYQIQHYGKILNANRSYYLTRTQPPLYTSMIREVFDNESNKNVIWLEKYIKIAIKEYETVWMQMDNRLVKNGLNRYFTEGIGLPPETESGHYDEILKPFAEKEKLSVKEFEKKYYERQINVPELDNYFVHDRSVRESGHDTSYRIEGTCAYLNVVELNAMLYKYETDFAEITAQYFNDDLCNYSSNDWLKKAHSRKELMNKYLWNEENFCFFDYNFETKKQNLFLSATCFFPLWAKIASQEQADKMIEKALPQLIFLGGIAGCSKEALSKIGTLEKQRQWDFPFGWPPHQMIIWQGLINYGYDDLAQELIYRWLWMITKNASDYNGTIPEKYNVVNASHHVFAEYGNQGTEFEYIAREGFGWMNASYQLGLQLLNDKMKKKLNALEEPNF
jgi:alpha,alpha-trehalase